MLEVIYNNTVKITFARKNPIENDPNISRNLCIIFYNYMKMFEYMILIASDFETDDEEEMLDDLGNQGWELVSIVANKLYLKKEKVKVTIKKERKNKRFSRERKFKKS